MIYWIIGIIIVVAVIGTVLENIAGSHIFDGLTGKLALTMGVLAIGSLVCRFITGFLIFNTIAKLCLVMVVLIIVISIIKSIFN